MTQYSKVVVFDLDGTLWSVNSHIFLLSKYMHIDFDNAIFKVFYKLSPKLMQKIYNYLFEKIKGKCNFDLLKEKICKKKLILLKKYEQQGYKIFIITNAPKEIAQYASAVFKVDVLCASIGEKSSVLQNECAFEWLEVITDNVSDLDLVNMANKAVLIGWSRKGQQQVRCGESIYEEKEVDD